MAKTLKTDLNGYHVFRPSTWIRADGEDAYDFLQSQFSNDLKGMKIGGVCYGLWLDHKGKVHGDSQILRLENERFFLFSYATPEELLIEKLNHFVVADDVDLEGLAKEMAGISILGAAVGELERLGLSPTGFGRFTTKDIEGYVIPGRRGGTASVDILLEVKDLSAFTNLLKSNGLGKPIAESEIEVLRIFSRLPSIPNDIGPSELPQEGGLEKDAVSFTKGCYLGQEVMSRLHSMGQVRKSLRLIKLSALVEQGASVFSVGKKVGEVKSVVEFRADFFGLALLNNSSGADPHLIARDKSVEAKLTILD